MRHASKIIPALLLVGFFSLWGGIQAHLGRSPSPTSSVQDWAHQVDKFYGEAADAVVAAVAADPFLTGIHLEPEQYPRDFVFASPCNEGLAGMIAERLRQSDRDSIELLYDRQPPALSPLGRWCLQEWHTICDRLALPDQLRPNIGLYQASGQRVEQGAMDRRGRQLHLALCVERFKVDAAQGKFEATLGLLAGARQGGEPAGKLGPLFDHKSICGPSTQICWFARQTSPETLIWTNAGLFLAVLAVAGIWRLAQRGPFRDHLEPPSRMGLWCVVAGQVCVLILLLLSPLPRQPIRYNPCQQSLYLFVDTNREIWFAAPSDDRVSPARFASMLEEALRNRFVEVAGSAHARSFWRWLWWDALPAVYYPQSYALNSPYELQVYAYSGDAERSSKGGSATSSVRIPCSTRACDASLDSSIPGRNSGRQHRRTTKRRQRSQAPSNP